MKRIIGACLIAGVLGGMFAATVWIDGWKAALAVWGIAYSITAVIILGAWLLAGD